MFGSINRATPRIPASAMKTYGMRAPRSTHFRPATCDEVDCQNLANGWRVNISALPAGLVYQARNCGRKFTELNISAEEHWLVYEAGQQCFAPHKMRIDKPEIFIARDGDWRGNPRGTPTRRFNNGADWVDDFSNHAQKIADQLERG